MTCKSAGQLEQERSKGAFSPVQMLFDRVGIRQILPFPFPAHSIQELYQCLDWSINRFHHMLTMSAIVYWKLTLDLPSAVSTHKLLTLWDCILFYLFFIYLTDLQYGSIVKPFYFCMVISNCVWSMIYNYNLFAYKLGYITLACGQSPLVNPWM